jgi:hypothetical protein
VENISKHREILRAGCNGLAALDCRWAGLSSGVMQLQCDAGAGFLHTFDEAAMAGDQRRVIEGKLRG